MSKSLVLSAGLLCCALIATLPAGDAGVDGEGFVRDWLLLAPIDVEAGSGGTEIDKVQIEREGDLKPKAGDKQKVGTKEVAWKAVAAKDYNLDINLALAGQHSDVLAYLVTYITADKDLPGLTMAISTNDQGKVWLNGKEVDKCVDTRSIDKDQDKVAVALVKGVNVVVFKVINEQNDWAAALRFLDKDGKPVPGLTAKTAP